MSSFGAVGIGDDVDFVPSTHGDGDVVEREAGKSDVEDDDERVGAVDGD